MYSCDVLNVNSLLTSGCGYVQHSDIFSIGYANLKVHNNYCSNVKLILSFLPGALETVSQ